MMWLGSLLSGEKWLNVTIRFGTQDVWKLCSNHSVCNLPMDDNPYILNPWKHQTVWWFIVWWLLSEVLQYKKELLLPPRCFSCKKFTEMQSRSRRLLSWLERLPEIRKCWRSWVRSPLSSIDYWASVPQVCSVLPENWGETGAVIAASHFYFTAQSPG